MGIKNNEKWGIDDKEINQSFTKGVFCARKAEYLKKIKCKEKEYTYWDTTF